VSDGNHPARRPCSSKDRLSIKGHPTEDAVLCTADKTYTLRSVALSNTVLVVTPSRTDPGGTVHVRDQLHEVLEVVPSVPKLHTLSVRLRGMEYDEGDEERRVRSRIGIPVCTDTLSGAVSEIQLRAGPRRDPSERL
jgi:hypothetical protein